MCVHVMLQEETSVAYRSVADMNEWCHDHSLADMHKARDERTQR